VEQRRAINVNFRFFCETALEASTRKTPFVSVPYLGSRERIVRESAAKDIALSSENLFIA